LVVRRFKQHHKKIIKRVALLSLLSLFGVGGVVAANTITLNQGVPISLGAGYTASTACDNSITINTQNQFINNKFVISTISLSDIDATYPTGCGSSVLDLSLIVDGALVNTSFSIASSAANNNYQFGGSTGGGLFANTALTPFDITSLSSIALSAYKVSAITYAVGDIAPGGGRVFYVSASPFSCGPTLTASCTYLEAAPTTGSNSWIDSNTATSGYVWSGNTSTAVGTTSTAIGAGYKNTLAMITQSNTAGMAGTASQAYRGPNNLTDWYLPSSSELTQMCKWQKGQDWVSDATTCGTGAVNMGIGAAGFSALDYSSSSEVSSTNAYIGRFLASGVISRPKTNSYYVRPIRAF
jgi:hypothetical protein